ncbi:glycosyltransferase family 2 protein [Candidatus Pelagibacter sp.]|nr:glycosyltransferase family 2 protein [Candidatus Pelagibacter sp.]
MDKSVSLVISCFNEEGNIDKLVDRCKKILEIKNSELILVNNGSNDNTKNIIQKHADKNQKIKLVNIQKNIGFGNGIWEGLKIAKYNILAYTHADLQTDPEDIIRGLKILENDNQFIKGLRINKLKNEWSYFDIFISFSMTIFTSILLRTYLKDIHAQPVLFSKKLLEQFKFFPKDFMIDVWIFYIAKLNKYEVMRFPVIFNKNARFYGEGNNDNLLKTIKGSILHIIGTIKLLGRAK